jgi:hypothetical protein
VRSPPMTMPAGYRVSLYFADPTLASAFVAGWCASSKVETAGGMFGCGKLKPSIRETRFPVVPFELLELRHNRLARRRKGRACCS